MSGFSHMLTFTGAEADGPAFRDWLRKAAIPALTLLPAARAIDLYEPAGKVYDPYLDDGAGPLAMIQTDFGSIEAAERALADPGFIQTFEDQDGCPVDTDATHDLMERRIFRVPGNPEWRTHAAPISYVVRYHRPAEDEEEFIAHYLVHHPPMLAEFPNIRNVFCYVPVTWQDPTGIPEADYMLGNEVAFDSLAHLDGALNSPIRDRLREDYNSFPPFSGKNTHYPMKRTRLSG